MASDGNQSDSAEDSDQGHRPKVWANVQREDAGIGSPQARSAWSVPAGEAPSYPDDKKKAFWDSPYVKKLKQIFTPGKTPKSAEPSSDTEAALRPKSNRKSKAKLEALLFSRLDSKNERKWDIKGANEQPFQKWRSEHGLLALAGGALLGLLLGLIIWAIVFNSPAIGIHLAWHYALVGTGIGAISGASFPRSFVDFFLNVWGVLKEIKRLMSTAIIISVYYQASDKSDHSSADNPQSPRPSDQIPQKFTLPNAPSSETKKRLSYSPPTQELERKPSSPEISPGPLSESRAEGSEAAATDTQATPDHVRDAMEVENLLAKQFRWRFFALWGSQLPVPHLPLKKMDNNPGATWSQLVNPGLFSFTKKKKKDLKNDIDTFNELTLNRSKPRGDKRNDFCCALSGSFSILLAGFVLTLLCFAGTQPVIQLILRCLGNPHAGDCKCCHICTLHCFDTQANQFVEGGNSITVLDDWTDGVIGTAEEISDKLVEGLNFVSQAAVCAAPGTQAGQTVKTMANAIKHQITATSSAMQELLARGGWSWYVDECDCECDFDNMSVDDLTVVAKSGETEDCSAKLVCECGSGDAESDALCNGNKCTPCPSNAATKSDQQPYCSINVARSSIHMDQNCLSVVELEVETNTPIESLEVHYALFATNQELYQNSSAAGLRHIAAWADTFAEHPCGTRLAAGTWTVEGTDRPRVARVTGNIAGAPIDFGCLQNSNCSVAGSTHLPTWAGGCSQSLRPDVLYTLALVCEVEFCPECSLGRTQLGRTWEQVITLPELGPARFTDKTAPLNIGRHSFDLNVSISKPGRVHWTVLDPEGAADGSSTGSDAQCAGESIYDDWSCIPYDSRRLEDPITGQLQVDTLEERAAHVWGAVPWCQDCTGSCSVAERAQDAGAWADIPYGGHSPGVDVLCSGWEPKAIMQAAAANGSSDASPLPAAAGFGCMSFRPVAGGAVDVQTSTLVQVLPRCVPDGDTCASATSPPTSDCPHRQMLERCHTYVVCMTVQKEAVRDAATTTAASCSEDTTQEEELAPTRCFSVTTACHNPWVDVRGWRADAGSLTIPFGGLEGESLPVYWMLEKQFVSSPGPSCDGLFNLDGSPYALRLGSTTVVDCATAHTASQTTGCQSTVVAQLAGLTCLEPLVHSQLMPGRSVVASGIVQVHCNAGCDGPPTVHVEGLEPGEEYILSTATVYKRHGCRQAVLHKGEWRLTTADNIPPELTACSLGAKFWSAPETVEVAKVRLEFEVCHVSKDNTAVALAVIQHDADGTLTGGQPAAASLISALSNRTCGDHTGAAPHNLVCSASSTGLGNLQATWPSAACAATGCVQHTCVDGLSVLMDGYAPDAMVPSNLISCGTYTSFMAFQDKFYNIQPQVTQHSFTAPDTEPPAITHRNRTGGNWFEWQVTPSEQAAMVLLVQEIDTCDNYGLRPSLGEEKLLQAAADEMLDEFLRGPSAPQIISGQLSSCCGGDPVLPSDTSTDLPGGDQLEYPTTTPEPQLGSSTNGTDSTSEGTFAVSSFNGRRRLVQSQAYTLLRTCQASGGSCNTPFLNADNETALVINEMQLNDRQESRLNITNLLEGHNYAVHYLMEDRGSQCGVRSAVGRPLFNRQPGSFCFTTEPNCDPLVTVTRPEGQNCLEVIVTFPASSACVISDVLHVVFGEPEASLGMPDVADVVTASQHVSTVFAWLKSNTFRRSMIVDAAGGSATISLEELSPDTEYMMYVVGSELPPAGGSMSVQTNVVAASLRTRDGRAPEFTGTPSLDVLGTDRLRIEDVGLDKPGVLWVGVGCPVPDQEVVCPESFRAAIARSTGQVSEDGQTMFRLLHGAAINSSSFVCEGGSCQASIALRAEDGTPLYTIPGNSYTVIVVADDGPWRPKDAPLAWRDADGCQPAMSEGNCAARLDPHLQTSLFQLVPIQAPDDMAPPAWCTPQQQSLTAKVESADQILVTAYLNETSRITFAIVDMDLWETTTAQLAAQDLLGCPHSQSEGFARCWQVVIPGDCANRQECALQSSLDNSGCCSTPVYQETIVHPIPAETRLMLCAIAEDLNPDVSQTSGVLCREMEPPPPCPEASFTRDAKPVFTAVSSGASFCQGFFAALPPSTIPPTLLERHASYYPTSRQYSDGATEPTFKAGIAMLPGEVELSVEIEGVSFATTTITSWPPATRMRLIVRSTTLHIDYPATLEVFFALSDAMGRTRVEVDDLVVSMSITPSGGGSINLGSSACPMSSYDSDAGVGRCSVTLSQIKNACSSCFTSTLSVTVTVVASYGSNGAVAEAAQEVQLAPQPGTTNFINPGAWLQVPQSPRHRCETFEVTVYGVTGDHSREQDTDGIQLFDIRLSYDTDILHLVSHSFQAPYTNDGDGIVEGSDEAAGILRLLGSMDIGQDGWLGSRTNLPLVKLSFRVKPDVAVNRDYPAALTMEVKEMRTRLRAMGTSTSVLDIEGVGQSAARLRVALNSPVGMHGYVSPSQDLSESNSIGAPSLTGSAADLRIHSVMLRKFDAGAACGCTASQCAANQDVRDNSLLQSRLATCTVISHSGDASASGCGSNGVIPDAATELGSGLHVLSMIAVEDEDVGFSLPVHIWAAKSIAVHTEKAVLRRVDGTPSASSGSCSYAYQQAALYASAVIGGNGLQDVPDVDVSRCVDFIADTSVVELIQRRSGGVAAAGLSAGSTSIGIRLPTALSNSPAIASAQVEVSDAETVSVDYIQITALTGREAFRTGLQMVPAIVVQRQSASNDATHAPLPAQFTASVTLRHDLNAADDAASLFASLHFSDDSTQDISFSSELAISPSPTTTCTMAVARQQTDGVHGLELQPEASRDCGSLLVASWQPCGQPMPDLPVRSSVHCQVEVDGISVSLKYGACLTSTNSLLIMAATTADSTAVRDTNELVVRVTYAGAPNSPVDMSTDDRVYVEDVDSELVQVQRRPQGSFQLSAVCLNSRQDDTSFRVCFRQAGDLDDVCGTIEVTLTCYKGQVLEALPWPACTYPAADRPQAVICSQPITQLDRLFCRNGPYQRAMLKQYVTHTNGGSCGGRIDVTSAATFPEPPGGQYAVQRVSGASVLIPTQSVADTAPGGVTVNVVGEYGRDGATRVMQLGSQGERPVKLAEVLPRLRECPPDSTCGTTGNPAACNDRQTLRGPKGSSYREALTVLVCVDGAYRYCVQGLTDDASAWGWLGGVESFLDFTSSDPAAVSVGATGLLTLVDDSSAAAEVRATPKCDPKAAGLVPLNVTGNTLPAVGQLDIGEHCGVPVPPSNASHAIPLRLNMGSARLLLFRLQINTALPPREVAQTPDGCFFWSPKPQNAGSTACGSKNTTEAGQQGHELIMSMVQVGGRPSGAAVSIGAINLNGDPSLQTGDTGITVYLKVVSCTDKDDGKEPIGCNFPSSSGQTGASIPMARKLLAGRTPMQSQRAGEDAWYRGRSRRPARALLQGGAGATRQRCRTIPNWSPRCDCQLPQFGRGRTEFLEWHRIRDAFDAAGVTECRLDSGSTDPDTVVFHAGGQFCVLGDVNGDCVFNEFDVNRLIADEAAVKQNRNATEVEAILSNVWRNSQATGNRLSADEFSVACEPSRRQNTTCRNGADRSRLHMMIPQERPFLIAARPAKLTSATKLIIATELRSPQGELIDEEADGWIVRYEVNATQILGPVQHGVCSNQPGRGRAEPCASSSSQCGANSGLIRIGTFQRSGLFQGAVCGGGGEGYPNGGAVAYNVLIEKMNSTGDRNNPAVFSHPPVSTCTEDAAYPDASGMYGQYAKLRDSDTRQQWSPLVSSEISQDQADAFKQTDACFLTFEDSELPRVVASMQDDATNADGSVVTFSFRTAGNSTIMYLVSFGGALPETEPRDMAAYHDCSATAYQLSLGDVCLGSLTTSGTEEQPVAVPVRISQTRWCEAGYCDEAEDLPGRGSFEDCSSLHVDNKTLSVTTGAHMNELRRNPKVLVWFPGHYSAANKPGDSIGGEQEGEGEAEAEVEADTCPDEVSFSCVYGVQGVARWPSPGNSALREGDGSIVLLQKGDASISQDALPSPESDDYQYLRLSFNESSVGDWVFVWLYQRGDLVANGSRRGDTLRMHTAFKLTRELYSFNNRIRPATDCGSSYGLCMDVELSAEQYYYASGLDCDAGVAQPCCPDAANAEASWGLQEASYNMHNSVPSFGTTTSPGFEFKVQILQRGRQTEHDTTDDPKFVLVEAFIFANGAHRVADCPLCALVSP